MAFAANMKKKEEIRFSNKKVKVSPKNDNNKFKADIGIVSYQ